MAVFTGLAPAWGGGGFSGGCFSRRRCSRKFISINNGCFW